MPLIPPPRVEPAAPTPGQTGNIGSSAQDPPAGTRPLLLLPGFDAFRTNGDNQGGPATGQRRSRDVYEGPDLDLSMDNPFVIPDLSQVIRQVLRRRRLNPTSVMQLREFSSEGLAAQLVHVYGAVLETNEAVMSHLSAQEYKLTHAQKTNITSYVCAFVYSPRASAYLTGNVESVLKSMRARGIALPSVDDLARTDVVRSCASAVFGDKRHKMKCQILMTLPPVPTAEGDGAGDDASDTVPQPRRKAPKKDKPYVRTDIAALCKAIVGSSGVRVTLDMLHRVAYLRYILEYNDRSESFWDTVDGQLKAARNELSQAHYERYFRDFYDSDIGRHGNHVDGFVLQNQLDPWQITVEQESVHAASRGNGTAGPVAPRQGAATQGQTVPGARPVAGADGIVDTTTA